MLAPALLSLSLLTSIGLVSEGPDLTRIDQAVAKCDAKVMTATFAEEPSRRRAFAIAAFNEQQAIVAARRALAAARLTPATPVNIAGVGLTPADNRAELDHQNQLLAERQQALDDARMLSAMRDQALDLMRQQYVLKCSAGRP